MYYRIFNPKKNIFLSTSTEPLEDLDKALEEAQKITDRDGTELEIYKKVANLKQTKKTVKEFF